MREMKDRPRFPLGGLVEDGGGESTEINHKLFVAYFRWAIRKERREHGLSDDLGELVREIVGLDMNAAKAAFSRYLNDTNLDARQIYFVNQIVEYIVHNGMLRDLRVLQGPPFDRQGSLGEVFQDLSLWQGIRQVIDQINANAGAA